MSMPNGKTLIITNSLTAGANSAAVLNGTGDKNTKLNRNGMEDVIGDE